MMHEDEFEAACMAEDIGLRPAAQPREIGVITMEIRTLHKQAQQLILGYAIEIGRRLAEAKVQLPYGKWGQWLKDEVEFSQSTANNFMRIFEEYGAAQLGLFGPEANSQTLGNLPYTKALQLLAVPAAEREDFAQDNNVEDLSSRQLAQLIRERDAALQASEDAKERVEDLEEKLGQMSQQLGESVESAQEEAGNKTAFLREELDQAQKTAQKSQSDHAAALRDLDLVRSNLQKAKDDAKKAKDTLKKLRDEPPVVSPEILEQMQKEAEKAAAAASAKELEGKTAEAQQRVAAAEKAAQEATEAAQAAKKKLELSAPEVAQFQVYFTSWQEQFNRMSELLGTMPPETATKLRAASGVVLQQMQSHLEAG